MARRTEGAYEKAYKDLKFFVTGSGNVCGNCLTEIKFELGIIESKLNTGIKSEEVNFVSEPILSKNLPHGYDYKPIIWGEFLKLREAAQKTADASGYPVYLVGSVLYKEIPRDIDVSVIMPLDKYEEMFGKLPENQEDYGKYLRDISNKAWSFTCHLHFCIDDYHLDIKVCPDTWWVEKPKFLLAEPKK